MYVIVASLLLIICLFFGQTIITILGAYSNNSKKQSNSYIGNMWFVGLLVVNALICTFIYVYYYYKSTTPGKVGLDGAQGFPGYSGDECYIKDTISCNLNKI